MDKLPLAQIAEMAGAQVAGGDQSAIVERISTDSRTLKPGELFVALVGENFDGHRFIEAIVRVGAAGAIVSHDWKGHVPESFALLRVPDTLKAYQDLAANYRKSLPLKVLGITGSNGKTSTKDFAAAVLGRRFQVTRTEGNFNNHVGLPRTVLEANHQHEIAVWELGMNHPGEIAALAKIAAPDAAIITNIGVAHLEFMKTREAIAREKGALAAAVGPEGWVILNAEDAFTEMIAGATKARVVTAGTTRGSVCAGEITQDANGSEFTILEGAHRCRAKLPVPGRHMIQNALLAVAAGRAFGLSLEECATGLASTPLTKARLQIREVSGVQFVDDTYNANPDSMKAALRTLIDLETDGRRIAVLGEMGELGLETESGHREVGEEAAALGIDRLITIGERGAMIAAAARKAGLGSTSTVADTTAAADLLAEVAERGDLVLVKGSRSARTEKVIEEFAAHQRAGGVAR